MVSCPSSAALGPMFGSGRRVETALSITEPEDFYSALVSGPAHDLGIAHRSDVLEPVLR
jgi:hypothetical protein